MKKIEILKQLSEDANQMMEQFKEKFEELFISAQGELADIGDEETADCLNDLKVNCLVDGDCYPLDSFIEEQE